MAGKHLVVLVHGIRTHAPWYVQVSSALTEAGFEVERTNFGRFDLVRFLLPIPFLKAWAATDVESDIRAAMKAHDVKQLSVIAHSFGTFVNGWLLTNKV